MMKKLLTHLKPTLIAWTALMISVPSFAQLSWGTQIGHTYYDLQTYGSMGNRIVRNDDGSMSVVWPEHWDFLTTANEPKPAVLGFGYNHYDPATGNWVHGLEGECWEDPFGCAASFTSWPEIVNTPGSSSDNEFVISDYTFVKRTSRSNINSGSWSNTSTLSLEPDIGFGPWKAGSPRVVQSGNTTHMIVSAFNDTTGESLNKLVYMNSPDGGQTWASHHLFDVITTVPDTTINTTVTYDTLGGGVIDTIITMDTVIGTKDSNMTPLIRKDAYAIHANGNVVAVTLGEGINNDWFMFKSTDNGNSWQRYLVQDNHNLPVKFQGNNGDGYVTNVGTFDVLVESDGKVHVFDATAMEDHLEMYDDPEMYKKLENGIVYWNDSLPENDVRLIATPDYGHDGDTSDYDVPGSAYYGFYYCGWPSAAINQFGNVYVIYSAVAELTEFINPTTNDTVGYHDLYLTSTRDGGESWGFGYYYCFSWYGAGEPLNIAEDAYAQIGSTPTQDDIFPTAVKEIGDDGEMHFIWQGDWSQPGLALLDDTHPNDNLNYIHYASVKLYYFKPSDGGGYIQQKEDCSGVEESLSELVDLYPNPAKNHVVVSSEREVKAIRILDGMGRQLVSVMPDAREHQLDISHLNPGFYVVQINTTAGTVMKKLVIE